MARIRKIVGAIAIVVALSILPISGAALAHEETGEQLAEFSMDEYAGNINDLIAAVDDIVVGYEPGTDYSEAIDALIEQWESAEFHEAVETRAMPLYPPIWAALGAFSTAVKEGAPAKTVQAKGEAITAALWQGYGALKLLATRTEHGPDRQDAHEHEHTRGHASGRATIDTINENLDQVLALYKKGQGEAAQDLIFDTYMQHFEGIEGDLIEQNAELVASLEADFNARLPRLIEDGAPIKEVAAQIEAMQADLATARELLASAEQEESSVF